MSEPGVRRWLWRSVLIGALALSSCTTRDETGSASTTSKPPTSVASGDAGPEKPLDVRADLDGDGRTDRVTFRGTGDSSRSSEWTIDAELATGTRATTTLLGHNVAAWAVDIDDDRRDELLVRTGGETSTTGSLVVFHDGALQPVRFSDKRKDFGWSAHSNCCPGGTADVACGAAVGGKPRLVIADSQLVDPDWNGEYPPTATDPDRAFAAQPQRRAWQRTFYRLSGTSLVAEMQDRGLIVGDEPVPPDLPLANSLACDAAQDS